MKPYENLSLQDMEGEVWRDVVGYEGLYQVSNMGRVKANKRDRFVNRVGGLTKIYPTKILKQINSNGYTYVKLCKNNIVIHERVNRCVAKAFIDNPENKPFTNHINGIRNDNRVENLEWATPSENTRHAVNVLGKMKISGEDRKWGCRKIFQFSLDGNLIKEWHSIIMLCNHYGIKKYFVYKLCKRGLEFDNSFFKFQ